MSEVGSSTIDRRTLMKGAAWSVPVLALAVAAPAATASVATATISFTNVSTNLVLGQLHPALGGANVNLLGSGPTTIHIQNTAGAISGSTVFTFSIAQTGGLTLGLPLQIKSIGAPAGGVVISSDGLTATFTVPAGIASGASIDIPITYGYKSGTVIGVSVAPSYSLTASISGGGSGTGTVTAAAAIGLGTIV